MATVINVRYQEISLRAPLRGVFNPLLEERRRLFSGRAAEFEQLAEFIADPDRTYLLVTAPAGFGKTSLMAQLVSGTPQAFAYHFFTNVATLWGPQGLEEQFFLRNVVEQVAQWHGETDPPPTDVIGLRALYLDLTTRPLEQTQVLVLDGIDEVDGWSVVPYLAHDPPDGLHIILTARETGQNWMQELGLPSKRTEPLSIGGLSEAEVAEVLRKAGASAARVADDPAALDELMRVAAPNGKSKSGADPFYVRILAEDVAKEALTGAQIAERPPSLDEYLDEWWGHIDAAAESLPVRDLVGTLTVALGPIGATDLLALNPSLTDPWKQPRLNDVVRGVRRFLVGTLDDGIALAHPRLRDQLRKRISWEHYEQRLLAFCSGWANNASRYALSYYAQHLADARRDDDLEELLDAETPAGRNAWYEAKGADAAVRPYLSDVDRAWSVAYERSCEQLAAGDDATSLDHEMRQALTLASINSRTHSLPVPLVIELVRKRTWQPARAVSLARQLADPGTRAVLLLRLSAIVDEPEAAMITSEGARTAADAINSGQLHWGALASVVPTLPQAHREEVIAALPQAHREEVIAALQATEFPPWAIPGALGSLKKTTRARAAEQALVRARGIDMVATRADAIADLAPSLPAERWAGVVEEALATARRIEGGAERAAVLSRLAPHMQPPLRAVAVCEAFEGLHEASLPYRARLVGELGRYLALATEPERAAALEYLERERYSGRVVLALSTHLTTQHSDVWLTTALAEIRAHSGVGERDDLLHRIAVAFAVAGRADDALDVWGSIALETARARALAAIAGNLPVTSLGEGQALARTLQWEQTRDLCLAAFALRLVGTGDPEGVVASLAEIESDQHRARVLVACAGQRQRRLLDSVIGLARNLKTSEARESTLAILLPRRGELGDVREAGQAARALELPRHRARALAGLSRCCSPEQRGRLVADALTTLDEVQPEHRAAELAALAPSLAEPDLTRRLEAAIDEASGLPNPMSRQASLLALAPCLPAELLRLAAAAAEGIDSTRERSETLAGLITFQPEDEASSTAERVATGALAANERPYTTNYWPSEVLVALLPHLARSRRAAALRAVLESVRESEDIELRSVRDLAVLLPPKLVSDAITLLRADRPQAELLGELSRHAPETEGRALRSEVLDAALTPDHAHDAIDEHDELETGMSEPGVPSLVTLAPALEEHEVRAAISRARDIHNEFRRSKLTAQLLPRLAELSSADEAAGIAWELEFARHRREVLAQLATGLGPDQKARALEDGLDLESPAGEAAGTLLIALIPTLSPEQLLQVHDRLLRVWDEWSPRTLAVLADAEPRETVREVVTVGLERARQIRPGLARSLALAELAARLPEAERHAVVAEAIDAAKGTVSSFYRKRAFADIAIHLVRLGEGIPGALDVLEQVGHADAIEAFVELAAMLEPPERDAVLTTAVERFAALEHPDERSRAITSLAPLLGVELQRELLQALERAAGDADHDRWICDSVIALAPHLDERLRARHADVTRTLSSEPWAALARLAADDRDDGRQLVTSALEAIPSIENERERAEALEHLGPYLTDEFVADGLTLAATIAAEASEARAVAGLARHASAIHLLDFEAVASEIEDELWRSHARMGIVDMLLRAGRPAAALDVARDLYWKADRVESLLRVAEHLDEPDKSAALGGALDASGIGSNIDDVERMVDTVARLAADGYRLEPLIEAAASIDFATHRVAALECLVSRLLEAPPSERHQRLHRLLRRLATRGRDDLLADIYALVPVIRSLGGDRALRAVTTAIHDVQRWWP